MFKVIITKLESEKKILCGSKNLSGIFMSKGKINLIQHWCFECYPSYSTPQHK